DRDHITEPQIDRRNDVVREILDPLVVRRESVALRLRSQRERLPVGAVHDRNARRRRRVVDPDEPHDVTTIATTSDTAARMNSTPPVITFARNRPRDISGPTSGTFTGAVTVGIDST